MHLTPDQTIVWQHGPWKLNGTILTTWLLMILLTVAARLATRRLVNGGTQDQPSRWQCAMEIVVTGLCRQIREAGLDRAADYLSFIGTLFLFIAAANALTIVPFYDPPTSSLSTTTALAISVFVAVPWYGIKDRGLLQYLHAYLEPSIVMLPFNIVGEVSRTFALAVRLFGNMMSGSMIIAVLLTITPLFFPVVMSLLGLLTGMVQAYIFSILAVVYIAAATKAAEV